MGLLRLGRRQTAASVWIAAGVKLIREIGAEKYLHMVISNLRQTFEIKIRP
jgi:hypothetical protein